MAYKQKDGPPTLLLTGWAMELTKRLEGYREPSAMFGSHQRSVTRMAAKRMPATFENFDIEHHLSSLIDTEKLKNWRLDVLEEQSKYRRAFDEPFETTKERVQNTTFPALTAFTSVFFMGLPDRLDSGLPQTCQAAARLDELSFELLKQQMNGNGGSLDGYKHALLNSPAAPPEFWRNPRNGRDLRPLFEQATDWPMAWRLTETVIFHQRISLLALWDVEYCASMFSALPPTPLFLQLAPRLRTPEWDWSGGRRLREKDKIASPFAQLIDFVWCLLRRLQDGSWPACIPTDEEMKRSFHRCDDDLPSLRRGRPALTRTKFEAWWPENIRNTEDAIIGPPITLLAVAHLWKLMGPNQALLLVDYDYIRAWYLHRAALGLNSAATQPADEHWPRWLNRGLDGPAPG